MDMGLPSGYGAPLWGWGTPLGRPRLLLKCLQAPWEPRSLAKRRRASGGPGTGQGADPMGPWERWISR